MSDVRDALAEAMALNKRLAASCQVRKEKLGVELAQLRGKRRQIDGIEGAEAESLRTEIDGRLAAMEGELATVEGQLAGALKEMDELRKLAQSAPEARATIAAATEEKDPILQSPEEAALDRARAHIREMDALVSLGETSAAEATEKPAAAPAAEDAEAEARAEWDALRTRREKPPKKTL